MSPPPSQTPHYVGATLTARQPLLRVQPGHIQPPGHMLRACLFHHHAEHGAAQPGGEEQADARVLYRDEPGDRPGERPACAAAPPPLAPTATGRSPPWQAELLTSLFRSIEATPFKLPDDEDGLSMAFFNPERDGWLVKEGGGHKSWKRRWFTLCNNCLYYFETPDASKPRGTIPLENLIVREITNSKKQHCTAR